MTSASELFYTRRSRFGRPTVDLGLDSPLDRTLHHQTHHRRHHNQNGHNNHRRDRHSNLDGCDPFRRSSSHLRHPPYRPSPPDRELVQLDQDSSQPASGNTINWESFSTIGRGVRSSGNERLPGAVLLARERLLQRLRGVSLSGNRQSNGTSSGIFRNETLGEDFRLAYADDWETGTSVEPARGISFFDSISETERMSILEETSKRPPGLTQEDLDNLHLEVFSNVKNGEGAILSESLECSICLESFMDGDELMCLPCHHRFHSCCLDPWVRACGDCPNCRSGIAVSSYGDIKGT